MYSMNRRMWPSARAQRAIGTIDSSLIPRRTTMFTLIGSKPDRAGGRDPVEDARDREVDAVHRPEGRLVERVEADRDPPEPGRPEGRRQRAEGRAVRRQGQVDGRAVARAQLGQHRDEVGQVAPDERLAARDPELLDALGDERAGEPDDLLEGQDLVPRQEREVPAVDLLGHAVGAPEVAAVGDRDPQVVETPPEPVGDQPGGNLRRRRDAPWRHGTGARPGCHLGDSGDRSAAR